MRYLGLDLGRATIGIALADPIIRTARALKTIRRSTERRDFATIRGIVEEYEISRAILGLPLNMDGTESSSTRLSRAFASRLETILDIPVELFDERLSTFEAQSRLREQGISGRSLRTKVDAEAAAVILQDWLDRRDV